MNINKQLFIESAKFIQNLLFDKNINCYLIGGALINALRDGGILKTDDLDFAIISDELNDLSSLIPILEKHFPYFCWSRMVNFLSINLNGQKDQKIDFFKFKKKHLNFYLNDETWIHERICHFQTFKTDTVVLENKKFLTMHRPDLFLKTVYGNYNIQSQEYYNEQGGDTSHLRECNFYIDKNNFNTIDFKIENLKIFFLRVNVCRDFSKIDYSKINIFDEVFAKQINKNNNLFYSDFKNFLINNKITFDDF